MTLRDPFAGGASTTSVTLEGELVDSATSNEIDLLVTGPNAAGAVVTFVRTSQFNACNNASLSGNFGVVGEGLFTSTAGAGLPIGMAPVNETAACSTSSMVQTSVRQAMQFVFTDPGVIGFGTAKPQ